MTDAVDARSPIVTLVGDLSFFPGLASALALSACEVRRVSTVFDVAAESAGSLFVLDGEQEVRSEMAGARALHRGREGRGRPVLLLMRGPDLPTAATAYRGGALDVVEPGISTAALALRLRSLARASAGGLSGLDNDSLAAAVIEAPHGIAVLSTNGPVAFANPALLEMLGASDRAEAGPILRALHTSTDDDRPFLDVVPVDGTAWHGDLRTASDSSPDQTWAAMARRLGDGEEAPSILLILRDVTRLRLLERKLAEAQRMDAVGQLAGGVAHDFNNILSVITTLSDLLMRLRADDDPDREDLQEIFDSAQRGSEIARQLSAFSRPGPGQPERLVLNTVVAGNEKMLRRLLGEGIALSVRLDPQSGAVWADPVHLDQLIINLALNARDAMPRGGRFSISTGRRTLAAPCETAAGVVSPGVYAELKVSDSGEGMEESIRQRLFEPFFTTRGWGRHSGLGLSVVYGMVQGARGGIEVESELAVGTTLSVLLPALDPLTATSVSASPRPPMDDPTSSGAGETILLVEDHDIVREGLERALIAAGYRIVVAREGTQAMGLLRSGAVRPHLILSDVVMPSMSGPELEAQTRELGLSVPVVFMSGYPEHPEVDRLRRAGVRVVTKPIQLDGLNRLVRRRLDEAAAF